jgi:predicted ferric reductase
MIANLLNTMLGIWLVYVAVLDPGWAGDSVRLALAGVVVVALAIWARASDHRKWQSSVNVGLGAVLLILAALHWTGVAPPLVMFWGVFWPGVLVAILALWAVLYQPARSSTQAVRTR